jgi:hypothetical protein
MTDPTGPRVKSASLLEYRCRPKGCLLLRVWQTPEGRRFWTPTPKLSGRAAPVRDLARILMDGHDPVLADPVLAHPDSWLLSLRLMCHHVDRPIWFDQLRRDLEGRTPGRPAIILWPPDDTPHHK